MQAIRLRLGRDPYDHQHVIVVDAGILKRSDRVYKVLMRIAMFAIVATVTEQSSDLMTSGMNSIEQRPPPPLLVQSVCRGLDFGRWLEAGDFLVALAENATQWR